MPISKSLATNVHIANDLPLVNHLYLLFYSVVRKHPDRSNLKENSFFSDPQFQDTVNHDGKSWHQDPEGASDIVPTTVRKWEMMKALRPFSSSYP